MNRPVLDKALIRQKLVSLDGTVARLRAMAGTSAEEMEVVPEKFWAIQHGLQIAIQTLLDLGAHLLAAAGENDLGDYADVFRRMGERSILPSAFAREIVPMAGFRNLLVHGYAKVEPVLVIKILRKRLVDFEKFARHVLEYLDRQPD